MSLIQKCRICDHDKFNEVLNLGDQYLQGAFLKAGVECPSLEKYPLNLVSCERCNLVQLNYTINQETLYNNYWYQSGISDTMNLHLKDIVKECQQFVRQDLNNVLDIGSNDGSLLNYFPSHVSRFGIDPSNVASDRYTDGYNWIKGFYPKDRFKRQFSVITSIAMFYDIHDPINFAKQVKEDLINHGLWILEVAYLPKMLENHGYDSICNEHLCYYSLKDINIIASYAGLKIVNVSFNDCNGGSIRCYLTQKHSMLYDELPTLDLLLKMEADLINVDALKKFQSNCQVLRCELKNNIESKYKDGKSIHVLGASTKGNTILQYCGLSNKEIQYASDRDNRKHGCLTLGTNIPIISEEQSRKMKPNYYLVLPWHFKKELIRREWESLKVGTKFIFPLPKVEETRYH